MNNAGTPFPFSTALRMAQDEGFVRNIKEIAPEVFTGQVNPNRGSIALCREMAQVLPGNGFPMRLNEGCSWYNGSRHHGTLINAKNLPLIYQAQGIAEGVLGSEVPPKWTLGSIARSLLAWIRPGRQDEGYTPDAERLLKGVTYGYHECYPGRYPLVTYYDVQAYYYNMMLRVKSLNAYIGPKTLQWLPSIDGEFERYLHVLKVVPACKPLRNQLAGNMAGGTPGKDTERAVKVWKSKRDGKIMVRPLPDMPGRFRAIGLLLVRSGMELTLLQCHRLGECCVYANNDCVFSTGPEPDLWQEWGFRTQVKAVGDAEIYRRGCYRVGPEEREAFKKGYKFEEPIPRMELPEVLYAPQWL